MNTRRYALWGALSGALFPVLGTFLQAGLDPSAAGSWSRLAAAQAMPLLWLMDAAPLLLGLVAALAGRREDRRLAAEEARSDAVAGTSTELLRSSQDLLATVSSFSALTAQTATSVRDTTSTMGQLSHTATHAALTAETVVAFAESSRRCSEDGQRAVENATAEMLQLAGDVRELSSRIEGLNTCMRDIFEVASVVNSISERSQEVAARAAREVEGHPAGKAFAEIVTEMRRLSEDAQRSAQEVKRILGKAHKAMLAAMTAAGKGIQRAEHGAEVASATGNTIQRLATALQDSSRAARNIAEVAQLQDRGVDEVLKAMNEIFRATEETAAGTRRVAEGAHALEELAERLGRSLSSPD